MRLTDEERAMLAMAQGAALAVDAMVKMDRERDPPGLRLLSTP